MIDKNEWRKLVIKDLAKDIREELKTERLYEEKVNLEDEDELLVAAYFLGARGV